MFLFTGLLPWQFFSLSLTKATSSFVNERALLQKSKFSKSVIPISIIISNFINMLISLLLLLGILIIMGNIVWSNILLVVPALIWLLILTIGLTLFTSSLNVRYRDINFFVQTIIVLWFYATPILYNLSLLPERLSKLFALNPLTSIFELFHKGLVNQGNVDGRILLANVVISLIITIAGLIIYKKQNPYFVDWL